MSVKTGRRRSLATTLKMVQGKWKALVGTATLSDDLGKVLALACLKADFFDAALTACFSPGGPGLVHAQPYYLLPAQPTPCCAP
jgi:hypothetical protein